ncbi:hypothetical protein ACIU1J_27610 [Azospirillum doebereinerae]|uniref:hypothetical protein n=1 Tax=Azospirillum doebereinerae TaxID=92933 RepID=UPI001EE565A7|nr:hypothetical protein [Azospirillum doebereinerae]MCG5241388.1 hypothetical protein [Azospirillum doebereinerae]
MSKKAVPAGMGVYRPDGATLRRYLADTTSLVCIIQGPRGSGKSTASAMKLWMAAIKQKPAADGLRYTRSLVVRNTFGELKTTTIATWKELFPPDQFGKFYDTPPFRHEIRVGDVVWDVWFVALDTEDDAKKMLSMELTNAWINEGREVPRKIALAVKESLGRYPSMAKVEGGATLSQILIDTNAPPEDHWIPIMRGDVPAPENMPEEEKRALRKPDDWTFYMQPGGLIEVKDEAGNHIRFEDNPEAENLTNLRKGYYLNGASGSDLDQVRVNLCNQLGRLKAGKPVWPMFRPALHLAPQPLEPVAGMPILAGFDFGRDPVGIFAQQVRGQWRILHEFLAPSRMGASTYAPLLKAEMAQRLPGFQFALFGDPAGDDPGQASDDTPFRIFRSNGLPILPASSNKVSVRLQVVEQSLLRLTPNGEVGFLLSPRCAVLRAALEGGYKYRKFRVAGVDRYADEPEKNQYSHPADALQYLLLGGGEGRILLTGAAEPKKPVNTKRPTNVFQNSRADALRRIR